MQYKIFTFYFDYKHIYTSRVNLWIVYVVATMEIATLIRNCLHLK